MSEFFLSSGFLWGLSAAAAPIIIHLLARRRFRRVSWAAMEFLRRAMRKTQRRLRLENLLLLLLRTAAVVLVALALARPVLEPIPLLSSLTAQERTVLIAIDRSASMAARGGGTAPWERARAMALEIVDGLRARDEVYLLWVGDRPDAVFEGPTPEKRRAREEIEGATPWDGGARWTGALHHLAEILARPEVKAREVRSVYCLSDLQRTGWAAPGAPGGDAPASAAGAARDALAQLATLAHEVVVLDVGTDDRENLGVVEVTSGDRVVSTTRPTRVRAAVRNFGEREAVGVGVALVIGGQKHKTRVLDAIGPGETATPDFWVSFTDDGPQRVSVAIDPDALDRDNRRDLAVHVRKEVGVLVVDGDPEQKELAEHAAELLTLQLAPQAGGAADAVIRPETISATQLASARLDAYDCVILVDVAATDPAVQAVLRTGLPAYVRDGGALLVIPGANVDGADWARWCFDRPEGAPEDWEPLLPARLGALEPRDGPAKGDATVTLVPENWQHPLFSKFDDEQWRRLIAQAPRVKRYFTVDGPVATGARVLARFSDLAQTPALIERPYGAGRVLLLTTGWSYAWSGFYFQPGGLILANEMVLHLARDPAEGRTVRLGAPLTWVIEADAYSDQVRVHLPHGGPAKPLDPPHPDGARFVVRMPETRHVGFHQIELQPASGGDAIGALFAVVADPDEGDLRPLEPTELTAGLTAPASERVRVERAVRTTEHTRSASAREVWRAAVWALLAVLLAESLLARRLGRRGT